MLIQIDQNDIKNVLKAVFNQIETDRKTGNKADKYNVKFWKKRTFIFKKNPLLILNNTKHFYFSYLK